MYGRYDDNIPSSSMNYLMHQYMQSPPMHCIIEPNEFLGGIYLGNIDSALNYEMLRKYNIRSVLTVAGRTNIKYNENLIPFHQIIVIDDHPSQDLRQYFNQIYEFIESSRKRTNILVHCFAGVSRSASAVIMYLMRKNQWSFERAYSYCKSKRQVIMPNQGFTNQLKQYEKELQYNKMDSQIMNYSDMKYQRNKSSYQTQIYQNIYKSDIFDSKYQSPGYSKNKYMSPDSKLQVSRVQTAKNYDYNYQDYTKLPVKNQYKTEPKNPTNITNYLRDLGYDRQKNGHYQNYYSNQIENRLRQYDNLYSSNYRTYQKYNLY